MRLNITPEKRNPISRPPSSTDNTGIPSISHIAHHAVPPNSPIAADHDTDAEKQLNTASCDNTWQTQDNDHIMLAHGWDGVDLLLMPDLAYPMSRVRSRP